MAGFLSKIFGGNKKSRGDVLIVDDEPGILRILTLHLEKMGFDVTGVEAAESAFAQIEKSKKKFRIFMIDVMLVGQNGINLAKKIRKNKATAKTPIVLMSGAFAPSQMQKLKDEIPNCETVIKPFKASEIQEKIEKCLRGDAVKA